MGKPPVMLLDNKLILIYTFFWVTYQDNFVHDAFKLIRFIYTNIRETAFEIVRQKIRGGLTTRVLAEKSGAPARPIYSYFSTMAELEEEIVKMAVDLLYTYMIQKRTDNPWCDHGNGYALFAMEEKSLFRSINDEKHLFLYKKYGDIIWATLSDYLPFQGLSEEQVYQIQLHRWLFAHGLAFSVCNLQPVLRTDEKIISTIREGSEAIFNELLLQFGNCHWALTMPRVR